MTEQFRISTRTPTQYVITADQTTTVLEAANEEAHSFLVDAPQSLFPLNLDPTNVKLVQLVIDGVQIAPSAPSGFTLSFDLVNMPSAPSGKGVQVLLSGAAHPGLPEGTKVLIRYRVPSVTAAATDAALITYQDGRNIEAALSPTYATRAELLAATNSLPDGTIADVAGLAFVRDEDSTAISDLPGFAPAQYEKPHIKHWETHGDGVQDDTAAIAAIKAFCSDTGRRVDMGSGGTYLGDEILLSSSQKLLLDGDPRNRPILMLTGGDNGQVINTVEDSTATIDLFGVCLDGQRGTRSAGHGLRSGGALLIRLDQVRIQNCQEYGFATQAGTTQSFVVGYLEIDTVGLDGGDLKDYNLDNGLFVYDHIKVSNFSLDDNNGAGLDIRGPAMGRLLEVDLTGDCRGFRYRPASGQGRAGYGHQEAIYATGTGSGNSFALDMTSDDERASIGTVIAHNTGGLLLQGSASVGGVVQNVRGIGMYLSDAISLSGSGLRLMGGYIEKAASATGVTSFVDLEPTASRNDLMNLTVVDPTGAASPIRVQSGATDNSFDRSVVISSGVTGDGIGDSGTGTTVTNAKTYTS